MSKVPVNLLLLIIVVLLVLMGLTAYFLSSPDTASNLEGALGEGRDLEPAASAGTGSGRNRPGGNDETTPGRPNIPSMSDREMFKRTPEPGEAGKIGAGEAQSVDIDGLIIQALWHPDPDERASALSELGFQNSSKEIVEACLQALDDPSEEVRLEAVMALAFMEAPGSVAKLERIAQNDVSQEVRRAALEALTSLNRRLKEMEDEPSE